MPKLNDVIPLISAIGNRDYKHARRTVEAMIANERGNNREQAARSLEHALSRWPNQGLVELPREIQALVWSEQPKKTLNDLCLDPAIRSEIQRFLAERTNAEQIRDAGLPINNRLLLAGPPGNGKTSLAEALARSLDLIFLPIKLHSMIGNTMGATGHNIGKLFEYAIFNNTLLFLDELDAIGSTRRQGGLGLDKEYNSIINTLLITLDRFPDTSVVIGATNMPEMLDPALERRFNLKLWLDSPSDLQIAEYLAHYQIMHSVIFSEQPPSGSSWSRVSEFCVSEHKSIILGGDYNMPGGWVGRVDG